MKKISFLAVAAVTALVLNSVLLADEAAQSAGKCCGKAPATETAAAPACAADSAKACDMAKGCVIAKEKGCDKDKACCAGDKPCAKLTAADGKGCEQTLFATQCPKKAEALAIQLRAEKCCDKSAEILAAALPEMACGKARAALVETVKAKSSDKDGAQAILIAVKDLRAAAAAASSQTLFATQCPKKAEALAVQLRGEKCPTKSAEILASALPQMKCGMARAKLVETVKAKPSDQDGAQAILTAVKDLRATVEKEKQTDAGKCPSQGGDQGKCPSKANKDKEATATASTSK